MTERRTSRRRAQVAPECAQCLYDAAHSTRKTNHDIHRDGRVVEWAIGGARVLTAAEARAEGLLDGATCPCAWSRHPLQQRDAPGVQAHA